MTQDLKWHLVALREALGIDPQDVGAAAQARAEHWVKLPEWPARTVALGLLVGVDPEGDTLLLTHPRHRPHALPLWEALAASLGLTAQDDTALSPLKLRSAAERLGLDWPLALTRVLDFVSTVLPERAPEAEREAAQAQLQAAEDRTTLLGAALAIVARSPGACLDEAGYWDATRVARLIYQQAVYWFPLAPPGLNEAEAARLIARYLPATAEAIARPTDAVAPSVFAQWMTPPDEPALP